MAFGRRGRSRVEPVLHPSRVQSVRGPGGVGPDMKLPAALLVVFALASTLSGATRTPWTTSAIQGSPEPAKPFVDELVAPKLKFSEGLDLAPVPGTDRLLIVERRGKISSFPVRNEVEAADEVL